jgi:hypothetical protein
MVGGDRGDPVLSGSQVPDILKFTESVAQDTDNNRPQKRDPVRTTPEWK